MFSAGLFALLGGASLILAAPRFQNPRALELIGGWLFVAGLAALGAALGAVFHLR